jgi:prevent-host-death family protein
MTSVASRDLRNHTADVLRRVAAGERVTVTVRGDVVAEIIPPQHRRPRFLRPHEVAALPMADAALRAELAALGDESTDELGPLT